MMVLILPLIPAKNKTLCEKHSALFFSADQFNWLVYSSPLSVRSAALAATSFS